MPEIQTLLREYGDHLEGLAPAITVEELELRQTAPAKPTSAWQQPLVVFAAAAAVVVFVFGGLSLLFSGDEDDTATSSTALQTTVPSTLAPTTPSTVGPTLADTTQTTLPEAFPPPPAGLGDAIDIPSDQKLLAGVWIEAAESLNKADLVLHMTNPQDGGTWVAFATTHPQTELRSFASEDAASDYMSSLVNELAEAGVEQPEPSGLGEESAVYARVGRSGAVTVDLVRVGSLVLQHVEYAISPDAGSDLEEVDALIAAMQSDISPDLSMFNEPITLGSPLNPSEQPISYSFSAWSLPLPAGGEDGDKAEWSLGYEKDGFGSCTHWTGDVEPTEIIVYSPNGGSIELTRRQFTNDEWSTETSTVGSEDPAYLAAAEGCDRFHPLADEWGLGGLIPSAAAELTGDHFVYRSQTDEYVLVNARSGWSFDSEPGEFDELPFDRPPTVTVTTSEIRVNAFGHVAIDVELEGSRSALEELFDIDLNGLPDGIIGVGFSFESGEPRE